MILSHIIHTEMDGENEYLKNIRLDNQCKSWSDGGGADILSRTYCTPTDVAT
jgi:hypothetical protein